MAMDTHARVGACVFCDMCLRAFSSCVHGCTWMARGNKAVLLLSLVRVVSFGGTKGAVFPHQLALAAIALVAAYASHSWRQRCPLKSPRINAVLRNVSLTAAALEAGHAHPKAHHSHGRTLRCKTKPRLDSNSRTTPVGLNEGALPNATTCWSQWAKDCLRLSNLHVIPQWNGRGTGRGVPLLSMYRSNS